MDMREKVNVRERISRMKHLCNVAQVDWLKVAAKQAREMGVG